MAEYKLSYTANEIDEKLKRIKDGGVGYTEDGKVYTFNGDTTGLETGYHNGLQFVVLADEFFDPNTIEHITVSVSGTMVELSKDQFWIEEHSDAIATGYVVLTEYQGSTVPIALIQKSNDGGQEKSGVLADPNYNAFVARLKFADTIHPIDPKYLPNNVLDLDAMGLTPYVLELANQGGGRTYLHSYEVDIVETIYDKFPTSWDFVAKLTISEPESMYVKPVYTTFGEDGYHLGHFDSYLLTNQETLNKFFVRIFRYSYNDNIKGLVKVIDIHVGFYT